MMNLAVFISGRGSNLCAINEAIKRGFICNAQIACVISNKAAAGGLAYAKSEGIETHFIDPKAYATNLDYDKAILKIMQEKQVDLICLAGYMKIVSPVLIEAYPAKIMNIHPSLLPSFVGLNAIKQALDYGVKCTGVTVHFVDNGMDTGAIILQHPVSVLDTDTEETLAEKMHEVEHQLYPMAIRFFCSGWLTLSGRKVNIQTIAFDEVMRL